MSYPPDPLTYEVELFLNGGWRDVTSDVLDDPGVSIRRGRPDQSSNPNAGSCSFTLRNTSGDYSPRWPTGQWYGSIGQNTPVRVGVVLASDTFSRTVASGWGTSDTAHTWTTGGTGGTVQASDYNVGGGIGTHSVPVANANRFTYLGAVDQACADVRVDVSLPFTDVTGARVLPGCVMLRGQSASSYYLVRVSAETDESVTIGIYLASGSVVAAPVTVPGLTHSSAQTLRIRAQAEGHTLRGKVWAVSAGEPYGWDITAHDETIPDAGFAGVYSGVETGNTNTKPIVFTMDNVVVKAPLFAGEIADMPAHWDLSGNYVTASVTAGGPLQQLGQDGALQSALRRGYLRDVTYTPLIYWPCEDGASSLYFAPAVGQLPLWVVAGTARFATLSPLDASEPLPGINLSVWYSLIPQHVPGSSRCQMRFVFSVPDGGLGLGLKRIMQTAFSGGSIGNISVFVDQSGNMWIYVYDTNLSTLYTQFIASGINGTAQQIAVEFQQTTATNVNVNLLSLKPGDGSVVQISPSGANIPAAQTIGFATSIVVDPDVLMPDTTAGGHISFHTASATLLDLSSQLNAWKGEAAAERIIRLGEEEDISVSYIGSPGVSELMGPQRAIELLKLVYECSAADLGELYESRGESGLTYRTRASMYNQTAAVTLDYSLGQLSGQLVPIDDDSYLKNDITVSRQGGSSARRVLETGRLSVKPPRQGGSGRHEGSRTLNVYSDTQLADLANWLLHLRTADESRYPVINLDLANRNLAAAGLQSAVIDLEIGSRLVINNPKTGQTVDAISQIVTGIEITLRRFIFTIKYNCVPESPYQVGVLDDNDKRLDSDTTTLTNDLNSNDTSFQVSIGSGALWTARAADLPIKLRIGGEIMSVGAVSGSTSPQTFSSVTRSVNGIVKSHSSGDAVHVAYPFILSL